MGKIAKPEFRLRDSGFTLVEIIIITALIGALLAIGLPNYLKARNNAARRACIANQGMIYTAATMYQIKEEAPLEDMSDEERLDALVNGEYLRGHKMRECPLGKDGVDDYTMDFEGSIVSDITCTVVPEEHKWP